MAKRFIFTITAGRTGTAWLASFLHENLQFPVIHEYLGVDDFGVKMPDIRVMRVFNERGLDKIVQAFWQTKFSSICDLDNYGETNHTLAKCGLIETLAAIDLDRDIYIFNIKRNWVDQCISYLVRADFRNMTSVWQWYLASSYARKILDPAPYHKASPRFGEIFWYIAEMEARQAYYKALYGDRFNFIDCDLESLVTLDGAADVLGRLGVSNMPPRLPPKENDNKMTANAQLRQELQDAVDGIAFDATHMANEYIHAGHRLASWKS